MSNGASFRTPLGEILLRRHLITGEQLARALDIQQRSGSRLGDILISEGMIGYFTLYNAVAESHKLPFADLIKDPPADGLPDEADKDMYLLLRLIPWRHEGDTLCIAVSEATLDVMAWIRARYGLDTRLVITSPFDIRRTVEQRFGHNLEEESRLSLWQKLPHASARSTMLPRQKQLAASIIAGCIIMVALSPMVAALAILAGCHVAYCITMIFKYVIFAEGIRIPAAAYDDEVLSRMNPHDLPVYTILIPMYREAALPV